MLASAGHHPVTLRHVRARVAITFALALLLCPSLAAAQKAVDIAPDYIVGIKLGMTQPKANTLLRKPVRIDRLEEGYLRLVSGGQRVEVYFKKGAAGVVTVTTWSKTLRTDKQIGPCSTIAALKRAYGAKLKPFKQAKRTVAYRLGNLIFTVHGAKIGVVGLGRDTASVYVALNAPTCS
jgi:hypothetical protein